MPALEVEALGESSTDRAWRSAVWAVTAAFGAYFCMYGFRKPFTAAAFSGQYAGIDHKTWLVTAQVVGYAASKFIGIRVVAETPWEKRTGRFVALMIAAQGSLLGMALLPFPWSAVGLFANGLALGMVFGMVVGFLEGRRLTEALSAGLCASFILADGVAKSVGSGLLNLGVREPWMPFAAGLLFTPPLALFAAMLTRVERPTRADRAARCERTTMDRVARRAFLGQHRAGLGAIVLMYLLATIVRSFRADFAPELYRDMNLTVSANTYAKTELWVMLGVLLANGLGAKIIDNRRAFQVSLATCGAGLLLVAISLVGWRSGGLGGVAFMTLVGLGIYLPYVAVHTTLFERLLAMTRTEGNLGFLMYVADAVGYLGYVVVMLMRSAALIQRDALPLFVWLCAACAGISTLALGVAWRTSAAPAVRPRSAAEEVV